MPESRRALTPVALAAAAGLLYYLGFSPLSWWPLTFLGATLLIFLLDASASPRDAVLRAAIMKFVALMPTVPYLSGLGFAVHLVAVLIHVACWGLMAWAYWQARRRHGRLTGLLLLPSLWTLAEWLGTVKHFLPSHVTTWSQALAAPALGLAPFIGAHGVTTLAVALAALPWAARRTFVGAPRAARAALAAALLGCFGPPVAGRLLYGPTPKVPDEPPLRVSTYSLDANDAMELYLRQGQRQPEPAAIEAYIRRRTGEFREGLRGQSPALVVLPEDAIQFSLPASRSADAFARFGVENNGLMIEAYRDLARASRSALAVGLTTIRGDRRYNSTLLIGKDGGLLGLRDKWKLTPGSEVWPALWLPFWFLFAGNQQYVDPGRQFSRPAEAFPPMPLDGRRVGAVTCLEGHMPTMYLGWRQAGAELVLFLGNAHWFHWDPGTYNIQLLRTVRLASAAYGLPVVMTGKANYAGAILPDGTYRTWPWVLDGGKEGPHEVLVPRAPREPTVAARWGEYYLPLSALLLPLLLLAARLLGLRGTDR